MPGLREGRNGNDWSRLIYERVGPARIPVIVNVPLVAEAAMDGPSTEDTVTDWIDELVGRWPPRARETTEARTPAEEENNDQGPEEEIERRLDEVDHQGMLDRLAVKAAIVKRRIAAAPSTGGYRDALERAVAESLVSACEPHVASWFRRVLGLEGLR